MTVRRIINSSNQDSVRIEALIHIEYNNLCIIQ